MLPAPLLKPAPRRVRLSAAGAVLVLLETLLFAGAIFAEAQLYRRAQTSEFRWPPFALLAPCALGALGVAFVLRRQSHLLAYGRPALATVRKVEQKKWEKGSQWRVHYEWTLLSGATRSGRYTHHKKQPPAVGSTIPIIYDRDNPQHHSRYPLELVRL